MICRIWDWLTQRGCPHEWETIETSRITHKSDGVEVGTIFGLRCKKCGDITQRYVGLRG